MNAIDRPSPIERPSPIGSAIPHDSAAKHVSGEALYIDDLPEPPGLLHAYIRLSEHAHARITRLDASAAACMPGVAAVLTAADIPGVNDVGPAFPGDPIFAEGTRRILRPVTLRRRRRQHRAMPAKPPRGPSSNARCCRRC